MTSSSSLWSKVSPILRRWFLGALLLYGGLLVVLTFLQSKLLYFPTKDMLSPSRFGLNVEDVWVTSSGGKKIHGWWVPHPKAKLTLLWFHGNAGNLTHRAPMISEFQASFQVNILILDYQGYGKSEGSPSEEGIYADAKAMWDWLLQEKQQKPEQIVVLGRSLGCAIASHLVTQVQPAALILDSPFSSFVDVASAHFPWLPVRWIARFRYTTAEYVKKRSCPLLVIHSPDDEVIPYKLGQRCYEQAASPKEFLQIQGTHNDGFYQSKSDYVAAVRKFLAGLHVSKETNSTRNQPGR